MTDSSEAIARSEGGLGRTSSSGMVILLSKSGMVDVAALKISGA